jgi:hypothetical protein
MCEYRNCGMPFRFRYKSRGRHQKFCKGSHKTNENRLRRGQTAKYNKARNHKRIEQGRCIRCSLPIEIGGRVKCGACTQDESFRLLTKR